MISSKTATVTLPTEEQILIAREFDAPAHLLWQALTTADLVKRWWGGERGDVTSAEIDLRVGGTWRYVMVAHGGFEVAFHGEYLELDPHERMVSTEVYEGAADSGHTVNTMTLVEAGGRTTMTVLIQAPSREVRDAIIDSGMEGGMQESYDALERVAVSLR